MTIEAGQWYLLLPENYKKNQMQPAKCVKCNGEIEFAMCENFKVSMWFCPKCMLVWFRNTY